MEKIKIIIDTDIGDNADDALAICLALKSPELDVLGITTVFRNVDARAKIAVHLLGLLNRPDISVCAGIGHPIVADANINEIPSQLLDDMRNLSYNKEINAIEYLYRTLMNSSGEITIVPIGPLTNIGVLLREYPEVIPKIKEIVMMGGSYYMQYNEWNIQCDPEAAAIVFESGVPIRAIGLDVTTQCPITEELFTLIQNHGNPVTNLLAELLLCFKKRRGRHTFLHDPMAVFAVYDKKLITYSKEDIAVELSGKYTRGTTFNRSKIGVGSNRYNAQCAKAIQAQRFVEQFKEIILS